MDALTRHRMLQLVGVPVAAMRVPPRVELRDDLEDFDEFDLDEDLADDESEGQDDEEDELDDDEPEPDPAAARHRTLELLGVELRARANPAPGRQVLTAEGVEKYGLPIGATIVPGLRALTAAQKAQIAQLSGPERGAYLQARRGGSTHGAAVKAAKPAKVTPAKAVPKARQSVLGGPMDSNEELLHGLTATQVKEVGEELNVAPTDSFTRRISWPAGKAARIRVVLEALDTSARQSEGNKGRHALPKAVETVKARPSGGRTPGTVGAILAAHGGGTPPAGAAPRKATVRRLPEESTAVIDGDPLTPDQRVQVKALDRQQRETYFDARRNLGHDEAMSVATDEDILAQRYGDQRIKPKATKAAAPPAVEPYGTVRATRPVDKFGGPAKRVIADGEGGYIGQSRHRDSTVWRDDASLGSGPTVAYVLDSPYAGKGWTRVAYRPAAAKATKAAAPKAPDLTGARGLSTDPAVRQVQIENRIREAYDRAPKQPGGGVRLDDLRNELGEATNRREIDEALARMGRERGVSLLPNENLKEFSLTERGPAWREAAVRIGPQDYHFLRIEDLFATTGTLRPLPVAARKATKAAAPKAPPAPATVQPATPAQVAAVPDSEAQRMARIVDRLKAASSAPDRRIMLAPLPKAQLLQVADLYGVRPRRVNATMAEIANAIANANPSAVRRAEEAVARMSVPPTPPPTDALHGNTFTVRRDRLGWVVVETTPDGTEHVYRDPSLNDFTSKAAAEARRDEILALRRFQAGEGPIGGQVPTQAETLTRSQREGRLIRQLASKNTSTTDMRKLADSLGIEYPATLRAKTSWQIFLAQHYDHPGLEDTVATLPATPLTAAQAFDPDAAALKVLGGGGALSDLNRVTMAELLSRLGPYRLGELRRIARALSLTPPGNLAAEPLRAYIAEHIMRDRTRWSLQ